MFYFVGTLEGSRAPGILCTSHEVIEIVARSLNRDIRARPTVFFFRARVFYLLPARAKFLRIVITYLI